MTDKEIQASDEEMEQFNISQNEKCVSAKEEKLNDFFMNKISFELKDATLQQGFEIICKRVAELESSAFSFSRSVIELTNTKTELENKVTELKKKIEKMKNCSNCSKQLRCKHQIDCRQNNYNNWE